MEKIKFRAWDKKESQMRIVSEIRFADPIEPSIIYDIATFVGERKVDAGIQKFDLGTGISKQMKKLPHGDYVLMQFAGRVDKEGKELYYNSDIVELDGRDGLFVAAKDDFDIPMFIKDNNVMAGQVTFESHFLGTLHSKVDGFKIVGDLFRNPELLK